MAIGISSQINNFANLRMNTAQANPYRQTTAVNKVSETASESNGVGKVQEDFSALVDKALNAVDEAGKTSFEQSTSVLTGEETELHNIVLASERADIALKLTLQVRNKVLDAYQEIMRMQI